MFRTNFFFVICFIASLACGENPVCDFSGDGVCDIGDLDLFHAHTESVSRGLSDGRPPFDSAFDLMADGALDQSDLLQWLRIAGQLNTGEDYLFGDACLLYTSPSPRDATLSRMPSSA